MKRLLALLSFVPALAFGQTFSVWQPGGDLSTSSTYSNQIIAAGAVTLAKMGALPADSIICNATGSQATAQYCTSLPSTFGVPTIFGTPTSGHCAYFYSPTQVADAGAACGSGGGGVTASGSPMQYELPVWGSPSSILGIATGTAGQALVSGGASAYPAFSASLPGVTSVNGTTIPNAAGTVLTNQSTTGTGGTVVYANSPAVTGATITTATIDNTTSADGLLFTDIQANALVGVVPVSSIPPSSVRYSTTSTCAISSNDNGNAVTNTYAGSLTTCTIPDIGTSGISSGFQLFGVNYGVNAFLLNRTTSSTINNLTSIPFAPGAGFMLIGDSDNLSSGVYNYDALITGESVGPQPMYLFHDTAQSGTNISDWGIGTISGTNGQLCIYALKDQGYSPGFASGGSPVICATRGVSGSATGQGVPTVTIGSAASTTGVSFPGGGVNSFVGYVRAPYVLLNTIADTGGPSIPATTNQSFIYQPANNQIGFAGVPGGVTTEYAYFNAAGSLIQFFDGYIQETSPRNILQDTSQTGGNNQQITQVSYASDVLSIGSLTDSFTAGYPAFTATRGAAGGTTGQQWATETFGCLGCGTTYLFYGNATFASQVKAADIVVNGSTIGATGSSGFYNPSGVQLGAFTNGIESFYIDASQNIDQLELTMAVGTPPTLSCISNCVAQNAGSPFTVTFTGGGSAVINGSAMTWGISEPVTLTDSGGSLPTAFTAATSVSGGSFTIGTQYVITSVGTTNFTAIGAASNAVGTVFTATGAGSGSGAASTPVYFVNTTGLATTTVQLCAAPPTLSATTWTACTSIPAATAGTGTISAIGWNNYLAFGGQSQAQFQLPEGTYSGAPTYRLTFANTFNYGLLCTGIDEGAGTPAQLYQSAHTTSTCNFVKGAAAAPLDWLVISAGAH